MSDKVAIIGPCQMVRPLSTSGVDVFGCESEFQVYNTLEKIYSSKEYSVVFITERLAEECLEKIAELEDNINIVLIPDHRGTTGMFKRKLDNLIKQATGALKV